MECLEWISIGTSQLCRGFLLCLTEKNGIVQARIEILIDEEYSAFTFLLVPPGDLFLKVTYLSAI